MRMLLLAVLASAHLAAEVPILQVDVVSREAWQSDLAGSWWRDLAADPQRAPEILGQRLIIPVGTPFTPLPSEDGSVPLIAFQRFLESTLNPQKNAARLLGHPDEVLRRPDGTVSLLWKNRLYLQPGDPWRSSATLVVSPAESFTWSFDPLPLPPPPPATKATFPDASLRM